MANVTVKLQLDRASITNKVRNLLDEQTMLEIQQVFAETIDPWTPFLSGELSQNLTIDSKGVTYEAPYSKEKYYGYAYHKEHHPLATSHWDEVAMESGAREVLQAKVKEILIRRARDLYG